MELVFKETSVKQKVYDIGKGFRVEIELDDNVFNAYLSHKDVGIKDLMFGLSRNKDVYTFEDMLKVVEANIIEEGYLEDYVADYMEVSVADIFED